MVIYWYLDKISSKLGIFFTALLFLFENFGFTRISNKTDGLVYIEPDTLQPTCPPSKLEFFFCYFFQKMLIIRDNLINRTSRSFKFRYKVRGIFLIIFHNGKDGQFRYNVNGLFELCFIMTKVCNLYANLGGLF